MIFSNNLPALRLEKNVIILYNTNMCVRSAHTGLGINIDILDQKTKFQCCFTIDFIIIIIIRIQIAHKIANSKNV